MDEADDEELQALADTVGYSHVTDFDTPGVSKIVTSVQPTA
jgi:hypothetical protein